MKPIASGYVFEINRLSFWCRMEDKKGLHFDVEIDRKKLSEQEKRFLDVGVPLSVLKGGTIRFTRIKPWTKQEIQLAKKRAKRICKMLNIE